MALFVAGCSNTVFLSRNVKIRAVSRKMAESALRPDSTLSSGLIHDTLKLNLIKQFPFQQRLSYLADCYLDHYQ